MEGRTDPDQPKDLTEREIQEVFESKVVWGEDLMRLGITGARVSTIEPRQG